MKKTLLVIAIFIASFLSARAQSPAANPAISIIEAISSVYNPSTKTNYKGKPLIIMTITKNNLPAAKARKLIPAYLESHNLAVEFILVTVDGEKDSLDWCDKMDIAAIGKPKETYQSPQFYFVNTDGSIIRGRTGFYADLLTGSDNTCVEFRNFISNQR